MFVNVPVQYCTLCLLDAVGIVALVDERCLGCKVRERTQ